MRDPAIPDRRNDDDDDNDATLLVGVVECYLDVIWSGRSECKNVGVGNFFVKIFFS